MLLIITSTGDELLNNVTLNPPKRGVSVFFAIFGCDAHMRIAPKWLEIDLDNLRMKFSAYRTHILAI